MMRAAALAVVLLCTLFLRVCGYQGFVFLLLHLPSVFPLKRQKETSHEVSDTGQTDVLLGSVSYLQGVRAKQTSGIH